jgi:hypothetical protein
LPGQQSLLTEGNGRCQGGSNVSNEDSGGRRQQQGRAMVGVDVAIDNRGVVGCRWHWQTAMGTEDDEIIINYREGDWVGEDGGEFSEIFDYLIYGVCI